MNFILIIRWKCFICWIIVQLLTSMLILAQPMSICRYLQKLSQNLLILIFIVLKLIIIYKFLIKGRGAFQTV